MKKILIFMFTAMLLIMSNSSALAANLQDNISVTITTPDIKALPVHEDTISIKVKNLTDNELNDMICYLTVVDITKNMSLPVDEFGNDAYQTREIKTIPPHQEIEINIPVKIVYVGTFKISASVLSMTDNQIVTGKPLTAEMITTSKLNKNLVLIVSIIVPILLTFIVYLLMHRRKRR